MDIIMIQETINRLTNTFNTVKNLDVNDQNYSTGLGVKYELDSLVDAIGRTQYSAEQLTQVIDLLKGPIMSLAMEIKAYDTRRINFLIGQYETQKRLIEEAQKAFDERQNNQGVSAQEFFGEAQDMQPVEQTNEPVMQEEVQLTEGKEMVKKLVPTSPGIAA